MDRTTHPVGEALVRAHVNADVLTVFGLAMSVVTAFVVGSGHLVIAIAMLFATGLPDLFDGPVAKASGTASARGSFFDSVADRVSDAFLYGGICWYLASRHHGTMALLPFAILAVVSLVSYERAKAELLGLSARGGLMERAERFILIGVCFLAGAVASAAFVPALWVFFGLVTATALGRFVRIWQEAEGPARRSPVGAERLARASAGPGVGAPELRRRRVARWRDLRADSRWKAWREALAQRDGNGVRAALHRRSAEPLNRWWARREAESTGRPVRTWRERRQARLADPSRRLHARASRHSAGDRGDGSSDGI
ncbi:MAG TPA: CDP-alcohol phosphatidyltransferase family protein [Acidimicrobiales bacterium]|nr:CDP-alcohol phosphatidyltransferase family protein [Acidimicrobiales bacterium]